MIHKSTLLRSSTKPPFFSIGGRFDQTTFLMRGVIVPPSNLIVTNIFVPPRGGFLIRGVIVPQSELIVKHICPPQGRGFLLGGCLIKGGRLV